MIEKNTQKLINAGIIQFHLFYMENDQPLIEKRRIKYLCDIKDIYVKRRHEIAKEDIKSNPSTDPSTCSRCKEIYKKAMNSSEFKKENFHPVIL